MPKRFSHFLLGLIILSLIIGAIAYWLFTSLLADYYLPVFPWMLGLFFVVSLVVHFFHLKAQEAEAKKFPRYSMAVNGLKIFLYMMVVIAYVFLQRDTAVPFLFGFFALYVVFSVYETVLFYKSKAD
jgi:hypothetical protein